MSTDIDGLVSNFDRSKHCLALVITQHLLSFSCRLSALYRYNTDIDGSLDFSSWAAFTASALEVRLRAGLEVTWQHKHMPTPPCINLIRPI